MAGRPVAGSSDGLIWRYQADMLGVFLCAAVVPVAIGCMPWWCIAWLVALTVLEVLPVSSWYLALRDEGRLNL